MRGSRCTELLVASSYGRDGASTRVRVLDWLAHLDIEADVESYLGAADVRPRTLLGAPVDTVRAQARIQRLRWGRAPERLLVSRSIGPFTRGGLEAAALRRAGWGVYDFDDALWTDVRPGLHRLFSPPAAWRRAVAAADLVVAGNAYLAEAALAVTDRVTVIPSCVEPGDFVPKDDYAVGEVPRLVWLGSPSTEAYLDDIAPALLQVHHRTGARLTLISAGRRPLGALTPMTDRVDWDPVTFAAELRTADCGIMPLRDDPFARGKCAYKLLQYGAAALPVVGSPVGVNAEVVERLGGVPARHRDEWVDALCGVLAESAARREGRGRQARRAVQDHYSYQAWTPVFRDALHLDR